MPTRLKNCVFQCLLTRYRSLRVENHVEYTHENRYTDFVAVAVFRVCRLERKRIPYIRCEGIGIPHGLCDLSYDLTCVLS